MLKKAKIIYADFPWDYSNNLSGRSALGAKNYSTLDLETCKLLKEPLEAVIEKDSLMFMWATSPKIPEALELMDALGYTFTTVPFIWIKLNKNATLTETFVEGRAMPDLEIKGGLRSGQGHYSNGNVEYVYLGKRGKGVPRIDKAVKQIVFEPEFDTETVITPIGSHSQKPVEVRDRIDRLFGCASGIELFARNVPKVQNNWTNFGNELSDSTVDIFEALKLHKEGLYVT